MRKAIAGLIILAAFILLRSESLFGQPEGAPAAPTGVTSTAPAPAAPAEGHGESESHGGPVVPVLFGLVLVLAGAKLGGEIFERMGQPAVLGELLMGILLGNLALLGFDTLDFLHTSTGLQILAQLGVIVLLFEVGLESNVKEMLSVGWSSLLVAVLGVVAPFFLGWGVSAWIFPEEELLLHLFLGATLCATSVGITARVLKDLGKTSARESRIILGAAVIDDVLGLVILSVVTGSIAAAESGSALRVTDTVGIILKAIAFLVGAVLIGGWLSPRVFKMATRLQIRGMLLALALGFCFLLAYLADLLGLATIVGAFAAGLILDEVHYRELMEREKNHRGEVHTLEELIHPIAAFLVPVFFVLMGAQVNVASFGKTEILGFAALLTLAALVGKLACAGGVLERGVDRISVAIGMAPRGEVGLIFASIGAGLTLHGQRVVSPEVFAAVVVMVIVTTLVTPPALKISLARADRRRQVPAPEAPVDRPNPPLG
jgi:Kef-type K+ transport system membrane component KefB